MKSRIFKGNLSGVLALSFLMQLSQPLLAAPVGTNTKVSVSQMGYPGVISQGPGVYSYQHTDETRLNEMYLNVLKEFSLKDRDYMLSTVKSLDALMEAFVVDNVKEGLTALSDNSQIPGKAVDLAEFVGKRREFYAALEIIKLKIRSLTALPEVGSVNQRNIEVKGTQVLVDGKIKADFSPLIKSYNEVISKVESGMESKKFNIKDPNGGGVVISQQGIATLNEKLTNPYTLEAISKMRQEALGLRMVGFQEKKAINDSVNAYTVRKIRMAIETFGKSEKYRLQAQDNTVLQKEVLKTVEDIMFTRSLMRLLYGVKLGTPAVVTYNKQAFNWDFFSSNNEVQFYKDSVIDGNQQTAMLNKINEAIRTQEARTKNVFSLDSNILAKVTSAITFLKGERALAVMNTIMLKVLAADIAEDIALDNVGGLRKLKDMFKGRYYTSDENRKYYKQKKDEVVAMLEPSMSNNTSDDGFGDVNVASNAGVAAFTFPSSILKNIRARVDRANQLDAVIAQYDSNSKATQDTQKRVNALDNL
ncbi:MAG: hypothetical protein L6Q37_08435 [Bdellovibrionaceae bacterium]|nr:hypothetical protein [Pseudobdellovibrionaceae bacterium]NUM57680.1 hypothetical protein [Pseudobdellovibrionaceae bacterium]